MFERLIGLQRQVEPKLMPIEVGINAAELMHGIEATLGPERQRFIKEYAERGTSLVFAFKNEKGMEIQVHTHTKRRVFSTSRSMGVQFLYRDSEDPSIIHNDKLKLKWSRGKHEPMHTTGTIKTNLDGVKNKNNRTAIQNAQRFIALLG